VHRFPREGLQKRDRLHTSTKFRLGVIRWVHELCERLSQKASRSNDSSIWLFKGIASTEEVVIRLYDLLRPVGLIPEPVTLVENFSDIRKSFQANSKQVLKLFHSSFVALVIQTKLTIIFTLIIRYKNLTPEAKHRRLSTILLFHTVGKDHLTKHRCSKKVCYHTKFRDPALRSSSVAPTVPPLVLMIAGN